MNKRDYKKYLKNQERGGEWKILSFHEGKYPKVLELAYIWSRKKRRRKFCKTLKKPRKTLIRIGGYFEGSRLEWVLPRVPLSPAFLDIIRISKGMSPDRILRLKRSVPKEIE